MILRKRVVYMKPLYSSLWIGVSRPGLNYVARRKCGGATLRPIIDSGMLRLLKLRNACVIIKSEDAE